MKSNYKVPTWLHSCGLVFCTSGGFARVKALILVAVIVVMAVLFFPTVGGVGERLMSAAFHDSTRAFDSVFENIMAVQPTFRSLTPDNAGNRLAYVRAVESGRQLFILDVTNQKVAAVSTSNEVSQIFGWSADDRYLAFAEVSPELLPASRNDGTFRNATWVSIFDLVDGSVRRLTTNTTVVESSFTWLGTNTVFFGVSPIGKDYTQKFVMNWPAQDLRQVYNYLTEFTLISSNQAAFISKSNIWECVLDAPKYPPMKQVSNWGTNLVDGIRWLRYEPTARKYFFCAYVNGSNWRHFYALEGEGRELRQLTAVDTYNGQLIDNGGSFSFVANNHNHFTLAVRGNSSGGDTNLFATGGVVNYAVASGSKKIFATASTNFEPHGIWEYDLGTSSLRQLVEGTTRPLTNWKCIEPQEFQYLAADGVEIPYFFIKAVNISSGERPGNRRPLIVYLPPPSWQFQKVFEQQSQLFANRGYNYLVINFRGCDGYGRRYSERADTSVAAQDVRSILDEVARRYPLDKRNVYLFTQSGGSGVARELLRTSPQLWAGVVLDHPQGWLPSPDEASREFPPVEIFSGDQDRLLPSIETMRKWASTNGFQVKVNVQTNCGHLNWKLAATKASFRRMVEFCEESRRK